MSSIDGSGDAYPIGECDNASRVIKYVGILGYRYSSYNLVDMRIHDINVVADLTTINPGQPVQSDGTLASGAANAKASADSKTNQVEDDVESYWTGPWPEVHVLVHRTDSSESQFSAHVKSDLLGDWDVVDMSANTYGMQAMSDSDFSELEQESENAVDDMYTDALFYAQLAVGLSWIALLIAGHFVMTGAATGWFIAALALWVGSYAAWVTLLYQSFLDTGRLGPEAARQFLIIIVSFIGTVMASIFSLMRLGVKSPLNLIKYWSKTGFGTMTKNGPPGRVYSGILIAAALMLAYTALLGFLILIGGN